MDFFPILAASSQERAVLLCFYFYLLNVLVPLIPAVIIYWLFPDGTQARANRRERNPVGGQAGNEVEANLGGWKIKAVGAWGAYVTTFGLGFYAVQSTAVPLIKAVGGASVWTIDSDFKLVDEHNQEVVSAVTGLVVNPPIVKTWGKHATITLYSPTLAPPENLQVQLDGYNDETICLEEIPPIGSRIKVPVITLKAKSKTLSPLAPLALPLAPGSGPADLTTTTTIIPNAPPSISIPASH